MFKDELLVTLNIKILTCFVNAFNISDYMYQWQVSTCNGPTEHI